LKPLKDGQYVKHFQYGFGTITSSDSQRTTIDFDLYGTKKFVTELLVVENAEGAPPAKPKASRRRSRTKAASGDPEIKTVAGTAGR
jgi:hypothetical protein